jgi:NAD(P)-dependent dehydrogenase (short-subunit alcohol dehydrogenase family)
MPSPAGGYGCDVADTVLITGATDGIGQELARRMLERGRRVIVHGRSRERAEAAVRRIGGGEVAVADLASFAQVRALVADVAERFGELGGLVNNAGIGYGTAPPRGARTDDGHEPTWQVNFLSAFLLTTGLRDGLAAGRGRVVHVSSGVHSSGGVDLEQPDEPRFASPYAQSKIALVMLAREQGARWRDLGVDVNACSPGWIATKMGGTGGGSLAEGVDTPLWLLTAPEVAGTTGRYFWRRHEEAPNPQVEDADARARLWELAERSTRARGNGEHPARHSRRAGWAE